VPKSSTAAEEEIKIKRFAIYITWVWSYRKLKAN